MSSGAAVATLRCIKQAWLPGIKLVRAVGDAFDMVETRRICTE